jgi:serine/threonine-protein kinase
MSHRDVSVYQVGDRLGDYEVVGLLGTGGMGVVYRVRNVISEREEAMKVLLPDVRHEPELAERFIREIKIQARLKHSGIAALHTAMSADNRLLMIMELIEGTSLAERSHDGPMELAEVLDIGCQVLEALSYAHSMGVVHRDVKPSNIIISPGGAAKLVDFGLAKAALEQSVTHAGTVVGSAHYMSPEQLRGEVVDARTDLYSVGVTLYKMATGRLPTALTDVREGLPARLSEAISKALEEQPVARFQTADEFRAALEAVRTNPGPTRPLRHPDHLDPAGLAKVEKCLSAVLGPIAHQVLSRLARRVTSLDVLCEEASREIGNAADRETFLRCCAMNAGSVAGFATRSEIRTASDTAVRPNWDPALLERTRKELARFIGPMARVLIERASKRASTPQQLWDALAAAIPNQADRERFQKAVGKL